MCYWYETVFPSEMVKHIENHVDYEHPIYIKQFLVSSRYGR
jgi:hypothetical protein